MPANELTSKERLTRTIHGESCDRVPISPRIHPFLLGYYGCACWMHYLKAKREFGFDPIFLLQPWHHVQPDPLPNFIAYPLSLDYSLLPDIEVILRIEPQSHGGSKIWRTFHTPGGTISDLIEKPPKGHIYGIDPTPTIYEPLIKTRDDLSALPFLFPDPDQLNLEDLALLNHRIGEEGLLEVQIDSAIDQRAGDAMGLAEMMIRIMDDPDLIHSLLDICHQQVMKETRAVLEYGVPMIFASWFYASESAGWGPNHFRNLFLPLLIEHVNLVHSYGAIYHYYDDGKINRRLEMIADVGVDVISTLPEAPVGDVNLKEAKKKVGENICLKGNIDLLNIVKNGTADEIDRAVKQAIEDAADGGRYILATSDAVRDGTPPENLHQFVQSGKNWGIY